MPEKYAELLQYISQDEYDEVMAYLNRLAEIVIEIVK